MLVRRLLAQPRPLALVALLALAAARPAVAQVTITKAPDQVVVDIDGKPFTVFHTGGETPQPGERHQLLVDPERRARPGGASRRAPSTRC